MSKYNLIDIFEGMSSDEMSKAKEADRLKDHPERDKIKKIQALMAKEKTDVKEGDAVDLAIEASQKKAGIKEDQYDDIADADDDIPADKKKEAALAYRKVDKGASYEKATSHIKEVSSREGSRIEGLLDRELKRKFIFAFEDLYTNLIEDDIFDPSDVIEHLGIELEKHIDSLQGVGDRFADIEPEEIPMFKGTRDALDDISIREESKGVNFIKALKVDANGTSLEIKSYLESLKRSGDKFDSVDDYVEDFKNYVADKSLQEAQYAPEVVDRIEMVRKVLWDTNDFGPEEIEAYTRSIVSDFERGDFEAYDDFKADDYVEDIKNYISDKALQEHFGRFMKDYQ